MLVSTTQISRPAKCYVLNKDTMQLYTNGANDAGWPTVEAAREWVDGRGTPGDYTYEIVQVVCTTARVTRRTWDAVLRPAGA